MKTRAVSEFFLRDVQVFAQFSHSPTEGSSKVHNTKSCADLKRVAIDYKYYLQIGVGQRAMMDWYWLVLMLLILGLVVMVAAWEGWPMKEMGARHDRGSPVRTALLPTDFPLRQRSVRHRLSRIGRRTSIVAALLIAAVVTWLFTPFAAVVFLALIVLLLMQDHEFLRAERFKDAVRASNTRLRISIKLTETLRHPAVRTLIELKLPTSSG